MMKTFYCPINVAHTKEAHIPARVSAHNKPSEPLKKKKKTLLQNGARRSNWVS